MPHEVLTRCEGGWSLTVHVQPGARRDEIAGIHGDALKIRLRAAPVEGRANDALVTYLAALLDVPRQSLEIRSGQTARRKVVRLPGLPAERLARALGVSIPPPPASSPGASR